MGLERELDNFNGRSVEADLSSLEGSAAGPS